MSKRKSRKSLDSMAGTNLEMNSAHSMAGAIQNSAHSIAGAIPPEAPEHMESRTANRREQESVDATTLSPDFVESSIHSMAGIRPGRKRVLKATARSEKASREHEMLIPDELEVEIDVSNNKTLLQQRGELEEFEAEAEQVKKDKVSAKRHKKKLAKVKAMAAISGASRDQVSSLS